MAELVQINLESTIPELEEMERVGLFTIEEIQKLIKRRKVFEYKLQKMKKTKEDFIKYIEFEMNLLALLKKRRQKARCDFKVKEIDMSIAARINTLFKNVIVRFPDDVTLWLDQIKFCRKMRWFNFISLLYTKMLQVHNFSPALWVKAAKWEMENKAPENARLLLQKGIRFNEDSDIIWREYFRMELLHADMVLKRKETLGLMGAEEETPDAVLEGQIAIIVYNNAIKVIEDVNFALSFLEICQNFDFAKKHIDHIFEDVKQRHPDKEETHDALSKQPLLYLAEEIKKGKKMSLKKKNVVKKIHEEVYSRYEEAVKTLNTEKMWSFYIEFVLSLFQTAKKERQRINLQSILLNLMQRADEANCLNCSHYPHWIHLLYDGGAKDSALSVSYASAQKWKKVSMWLLCLTLHIQMRKPTKEIYHLFNEALNSMDEKDSFPLWKLGVEWMSATDPSKMIKFFENGIKGCKEVSIPLKEMYLQATLSQDGIQAARELYKKLKKMYPISPELFNKMIAIENTQMKPSIQHLRRCYDDALREFGSTNVDLWLNLMKLEGEHPEGNPASYGMLYWKAMKTLEAHLTREFITRITLYATGHGLSTNWEQMA